MNIKFFEQKRKKKRTTEIALRHFRGHQAETFTTINLYKTKKTSLRKNKYDGQTLQFYTPL